MLKMPHQHRQIVQSKCDWCGKEIVGTKRLKYCQPTDKTKSKCQISAAAQRRKIKKGANK